MGMGCRDSIPTVIKTRDRKRWCRNGISTVIMTDMGMGWWDLIPMVIKTRDRTRGGRNGISTVIMTDMGGMSGFNPDGYKDKIGSGGVEMVFRRL